METHLEQDLKYNFQQANLIKSGSKTSKNNKISKLEVITRK